MFRAVSNSITWVKANIADVITEVNNKDDNVIYFCGNARAERTDDGINNQSVVIMSTAQFHDLMICAGKKDIGDDLINDNILYFKSKKYNFAGWKKIYNNDYELYKKRELTVQELADKHSVKLGAAYKWLRDCKKAEDLGEKIE